MRIAMIGAGNVGSALARAWSSAGHQIVFAVPDAFDSKYARLLADTGAIAIRTVPAAVADADVIALAVPWDAVPAVIEACGDLSGKIILDVTNPLVMGADGLELAIGFTTSGAEEVARMAPAARVFKSMNQVGFEVMDKASGYAVPPVMFVAGDETAGKARIIELVSSIGFEAIDAGPLRQARLLEAMAMLWIDQATRRGMPLTHAFALLKRNPDDDR